MTNIDPAIVAVVEGHQYGPSACRGVSRCACGLQLHGMPHDHRTHLAEVLTEALAPLIADAERAAVMEFARWVATQRAYNGSDYERGQSLYNECLNAVLGDWAVDWLAERETGGTP